MTSGRRGGEDHPTLAWIRANRRLDSIVAGLSVQDIDATIHQFKVRIDGIGTREVNNHMCVEIKTFEAKPSFAQKDTHLIESQLLHTGGRYKRVKDIRGRWRRVRSWGWHYLTLTGDSPANSERIWWDNQPIDTETLEAILTFRLDPDSLHPRSERRHHAPIPIPQEALL